MLNIVQIIRQALKTPLEHQYRGIDVAIYEDILPCFMYKILIISNEEDC